MLLFSTMLDINSRLTKDEFIKLVIEWNQGTRHESNKIPDIVWSGERNIRYGNDKVWLDIQEYRNKDIIAVRYEKEETDGAVWDTDYIMNFRTMRMSIRLERSYLEESNVIDAKFSTPYFITLLIRRGYLKRDGLLTIEREPLYIDDQNMHILTDVVNGNTRYKLPVVYISKSYYDEDPVDVKDLAHRLKGLAHVLVQQTNCTNMRIKNACDSQNEYYGAIGIYYPNQAICHRRYLYRSAEGYDKILAAKVIRSVTQYSNSQLVDTLFTWQGVNNALLRDKLITQKEERTKAESASKQAWDELYKLRDKLDAEKESMQREALDKAKCEADLLLESFEEDMQKLQDEVDRLSKLADKLEYENQGLRAKLDSNTSVPLLYMGNEEDFYQGEIKDLVLSVLSKGLVGIESKTRRHDVIFDIIKANDYMEISEQRAAEVKKCFKNYSGMTPRLRGQLEDLGYQITEDGTHYKCKYYGDGRYTVIYGKTPSDVRSGKNNGEVTAKKAF